MHGVAIPAGGIYQSQDITYGIDFPNTVFAAIGSHVNYAQKSILSVHYEKTLYNYRYVNCATTELIGAESACVAIGC